MTTRTAVLIVAVSAGMLSGAQPTDGDARERLWAAARKGDVPGIEAALAAGADVNARTGFGATALWYACYKGQVEAAKTLLRHGADPGAVDRVWGETPLTLAIGNDKPELITSLVEAGAANSDAALLLCVIGRRADYTKLILATKRIKPDTLAVALAVGPADLKDIRDALSGAGAKPAAESPPAEVERLKAYAGSYESPNGSRARVELTNGHLVGQLGGGIYVLRPDGEDRFRAIGADWVHVRFEREGGAVARLTFQAGPVFSLYERSGAAAAETAVAKDAAPAPALLSPRNWPQFRGPSASGNGDGQGAPTRWDAEKGEGVVWKADLPGLAHSSPVVWGGRVYLTTAVNAEGNSEFKAGLYGSGGSAKDQSKHTWILYCFDGRTGRIIWQHTAAEGVPKFKRHPKSSHANATPATDGEHVIAYFASEGLYCYDRDGNLRWKQDLGLIDVGAFNDPDEQWGSASSPAIVGDLVVIQCDRQRDSFIAAYRLADGTQAWRTARDEPPSWGTPSLVEGPAGPELVTNGTNFARGYDPRTGRELWRLGGNSEITVPTPIAGEGLVFITSGYRPVQPIYAVRPKARGDITLAAGTESSEAVAWSKRRGGPYMPTPIVYAGYLYTCSNNGTLTCYEARTGRQVYQKRVGSQSAYSASPVAADGRIFLPSEEGVVRVVRAGPTFELFAVNRMGDACMATPAISDGLLFVRTQHALYALGDKRSAAAPGR